MPSTGTGCRLAIRSWWIAVGCPVELHWGGFFSTHIWRLGPACVRPTFAFQHTTSYRWILPPVEDVGFDWRKFQRFQERQRCRAMWRRITVEHIVANRTQQFGLQRGAELWVSDVCQCCRCRQPALRSFDIHAERWHGAARGGILGEDIDLQCSTSGSPQPIARACGLA